MRIHVGVVGAGIAGLAAARTLHQRGHAVTLYEKSKRPGGRVGTSTVSGIDMPRGLSGAALAFDHGAQYFTVRNPDFAVVVAEWDRDRLIAKWTGRIVAFDSEGWEDVSEEVGRYVGIPSMGAIPAALASGLDVRFGHRVDSLAPLLDAHDRVIVAAPPADALLLTRGIDALAARVIDVRMQPCWAVMAAFEERVAARFDAAFVHGSPLGWIARNTSKPKRDWKVDAWVLHATNAWSQAHLDDDRERVGSFLMEAFEDLVRAGLPKAFYATVHRWRYANADPPLAVSAIHDAASRVTLCGDWCRGSRIEDAYLSGVAAANHIAE